MSRGAADDYQKFYFSDMRPMTVEAAFQETVDGLKLIRQLVGISVGIGSHRR